MMNDDLDQLIEEATVDTYDEYGQSAGFLAVLQDNLRFPFPGRIIDEPLAVTGIDIKKRQANPGYLREEGSPVFGRYHRRGY